MKREGLALILIAMLLSLLLAGPSAAYPVAVETLELEPATVTPTMVAESPLLPDTGFYWDMWFPWIVGDSEATE